MVDTDELQQIGTDLEEALAAAQARGWREQDIRHAFRRDARQAALVEMLLAGAPGGIERWRLAQGLSAAQAAQVAGLLRVYVGMLPALPRVDERAGGASAGIDSGVLGKVRALLAKAESTEFAPEADALFAKAHELMARHAIDQAMLAGAATVRDVVTRRVLIEEPYAYQQFVLLSAVAEGFACRVLCYTGVGVAIVFGMADDVAATEVLYTSLLLQATSAMLRADRMSSPEPSRTRRRSASSVAAFRRAFLVGFAQRIGARLRESRRAVVEEAAAAAGSDGTLLPVLAGRQAAVEEAFEAATEGMKRARRRTVSDVRGLVAGDRAGATATLASQSRLASRPALGRG